MSNHIDKPTAQSRPDERRAFGRRKTLKPARIVGADHPPIAATVVDISLTGARIVVRCGVEVRAKFDLEIIHDGISIGCEVVHVDPNFIGVKFVRMPRRIRPNGNLEEARVRNLIAALCGDGHTPAST